MSPVPPPPANPSGEFPYAHCHYHSKALEDHEDRLRRLERVHWKIAGAAALASGAMAFFGSLALKLMG
jgi:hypothetical protein